MTASPTRALQTAQRADHERARVLHRDILGLQEIRLYPLDEETARNELTRFARELWQMPNMDGYFDRAHFSNMRQHQHEAEHGFATLPGGGVLEILSFPTLPGQVMGFHLFTVFDPKDATDLGHLIGYTIWSLERGHAPFGQAEAVRMAFDIFPPYREHRYRKVRFSNHDIYNVSRRILYRHKPRRFLVDAHTQIKATQTGDTLKRTIYYLKRGYYPPDQKALADSCLDRLTRHQPVSPRSLRQLLRLSHATFWLFPVEDYFSQVPTMSSTIAANQQPLADAASTPHPG